MQKTKQEEDAMMAHQKRKKAQQTSLRTTSARRQGTQTASSVAGSMHSSHLSLPRTFQLQSRSRESGQAFTRKNSRASVALLEPLTEETGSVCSAASTQSHSMMSRHHSRLLALSQANSHLPEYPAESLAGSLLPEEPVPGSIFADSSSGALSQAAPLSSGAPSVRNLIEPDGEHARTPFSGAPSSTASISDAAISQHDNPFLGSAWSQAGATDSAKSMVSSRAGTLQQHAVPGSVYGGAGDGHSSLSYAPSSSHRDSQGTLHAFDAYSHENLCVPNCVPKVRGHLL